MAENETDPVQTEQEDDNFLSGTSQDNAILLLAAAEELGLDPSVVQVDSYRGGFTAPAEVVKKAAEGNKSEDDHADEDPDGGLPPKGRSKE